MSKIYGNATVGFSGGGTIGEWVADTTYNVDDIVTYEGAYYICTATVGGLNYPQTNSLYWKLLNEGMGGSDSGESCVLLSGTYTLGNCSPYNANYNVLPYCYNVTESVSGTCAYDSNGDMYSLIKLSGYGRNSSNEPTTTIIFLGSSGDTVNSFDSFTLASNAISITIPQDTRVSSVFYSALTGMME